MVQHNKGVQRLQQPIKDTELRSVLEYLYNNTATATQVAVSLGIYRPNVCRRKRALEKNGQLAVLKTVTCPITKHKAGLLTTNPNLFPMTSQLSLF